MKKIFAFILAAALMLSLAACTGAVPGDEPAQPEQTGTTQIPNPMAEQESAAAFEEKLGVRMDAPEGAESIAYFLIGETLAEVRFTWEGAEYAYRASKADRDIAGVYDTFTPAFTIYMACGSENVTAEAVRGGEGGTLVTWSAEGVNYSLYTAKEVDEAAVRALVTAVMQRYFDFVAEGVTDYPGYTAIDENSTLIMDFDGDGAMETLSVEILPEQDYQLERRTVVITEEDGSRAEATLGIASFFSGFVTDGEDGVMVLVSGDEESCDFSTWLMRYRDGKWDFAAPYYTEEGAGEDIAPSASGCAVAVADGVVTVEDTVDLLGSWGGQTQYAIAAEPFALGRVPGSVWTRDAALFDAEYWSYCTLKTLSELPVLFDGESAFSMLESGVKIAITESDGETYAAFLTEDGRTGRIAVERDTEEWGWRIDGVHETAYFESVPYAG